MVALIREPSILMEATVYTVMTVPILGMLCTVQSSTGIDDENSP